MIYKGERDRPIRFVIAVAPPLRHRTRCRVWRRGVGEWRRPAPDRNSRNAPVRASIAAPPHRRGTRRGMEGQKKLRNRAGRFTGEVPLHVSPKAPRDCSGLTMSGRTCPRCGSELLRIRRRAIDRVLSVFWRVQRYSCNNFQCQWEGNLHQKRGESEPYTNKRQHH